MVDKITSEEARQALLEQYTASVVSGEAADAAAAAKAARDAKRASQRQFTDTEASRLPVHRPKQAGQPSARMPFAHGRIFNGQDEDQ